MFACASVRAPLGSSCLPRNSRVGIQHRRIESLLFCKKLHEIRSLLLAHVLISRKAQRITSGVSQFLSSSRDLNRKMPPGPKSHPLISVPGNQLACVAPNANSEYVQAKTDPPLLPVYDLHGTILSHFTLMIVA